MADPFFSELKYLGNRFEDFIEVAVDAGTDVSGLTVTIYQQNGSIRSSNDLDGLSFNTVAGKDVYVIEMGAPSSFSGLAKSNAVSLSDDSSVYSFVSFDDTSAVVTATDGPAAGLTSTDIGQAGAGSSLETTDGGQTYQVQADPNATVVPCLTAGTLVETDRGPRRVEELQIGDPVLTFDGSYQPVLRVLRRDLGPGDLAANPKLRPVRILAGALGHGLPRSDLLVSRQHRMMVASPIVQRMFGVPHALVAAIRLTDLPGIFVDPSVESLSYIHLLFDRHEVIFAEGAPTESLLVGPDAPRVLPKALLEELDALFPAFQESGLDMTSKYLIPRTKTQARLVARHGANDRAILPPRIAKVARAFF